MSEKDVKFRCEITNKPNGIITPTKFRDIRTEKPENKTMKRQDLLDIANALAKLENYKTHVSNCNCTPIIDCQTIRCQQLFKGAYDEERLSHDLLSYARWNGDNSFPYPRGPVPKYLQNGKKNPEHRLNTENGKYNDFEYKVNIELCRKNGANWVYPENPFTKEVTYGVTAYVKQYIKDRDYKYDTTPKPWKPCQKIKSISDILSCEKISCELTTCQLVLCQNSNACQTCQSVKACQICQTCEAQCVCQSCQLCQEQDMYNNCCQKISCQSQCTCQSCQSCENISCQAYVDDGKDLTN